MPASATTARPTAVTGTETPALRWRSCGRVFECGAVTVPVDYADPAGAQMQMAVSRRRALDPRRRIGSLVMNFGGPGDPGTKTLRFFAGEVPRAIRERYDLVSFDPRGTGKSNPIDCIDDADADRRYAVDPTPETDDELRAFYSGTEGGVDLVQGCIDRHGSWLARVGTRNVAHDLDLLRAALGDDTLAFLGFSYGTVIGSAYAQQFPDRVGRMVLDAPIDLSAEASGEFDEETAGFERALDAFLRDCARDENCTFHSDGRPRAALRKLRDRFEEGLTLPVYRESGRREQRRAGVAAFYTALVSGLYDEKWGWLDLADSLDLATGGDGTFLQWMADDYNGRRPDGTYDNLGEVLLVILCADQPYPLESYEDFASEYEQASHDFPFLGGYSTDVPVGCDPRFPRPRDTELLGDVKVSGVAPVLVVGTTGDPATPYAGAEDLTERIDGSRLLTFVSTEHTAYTKNPCIDDAVNRYLLTGRLPRAGTRCRH